MTNKIKIAIILSDDDRWEKIEQIFTEAGYEMYKDYDSYPSIFDEDNETLINLDNYETLLIHKTDADADDTGKFHDYISNFKGSIVIFSGGIITSEIKDKFISINYDEYFKKNLISFLKDYKTKQKPNLYFFLGGESKYYTILRNELLNSILNNFEMNKTIANEKNFFSSLFNFFARDKDEEHEESTHKNVNFRGPNKEILQKVKNIKSLKKINNLINIYISSPNNENFIEIRDVFNKVISEKILKEAI